MTLVVNEIISQGVWPKPFRIARIQPVPKKSAYEFKKISITSSFGRLMTKIIAARFNANIDPCLPQSMFGGRSWLETLGAILRIRVRILEKQQDKSEAVPVVACDCRSAFDSLNHGVIIDAFEEMGAGEPMITLLESYLKA